MKKVIILFSLMFIINCSVSATVKVVTSTTDLAYYVNEIGGEYVSVNTIANPNADLHFVEVRPSYMTKIMRADIVFKVGMELDKWMDKLIDGSRNSKLQIVDCSKYIKPLEIPEHKVDASHGDIHPMGNPHYWIGPQNIKELLQAITEGLVSVYPEKSDVFEKRKDSLFENISNALIDLEPKVKSLNEKEIIYYHNSWPYFNHYTGIVAIEFIEPFPGVPPSPSHVKDLIELIQKKNIRIIAMEPYFDKRIVKKIEQATNAKIVTLHPSINGRNKNENYRQWLEGNIDALLEVVK